MSPFLLKILLSLAVLLGAFCLSSLLRGVTRRLGARRGFARGRVFQVAVLINVLCLLLALLSLGAIWGLSGDGVVVFASWSMLSNATAAVILFFSAPYRIGDRIRFLDGDNTVTGYIRHMGLVFISLEDSGGHHYTLPNNLLLQKTVILLRGDELPSDQKHCR